MTIKGVEEFEAFQAERAWLEEAKSSLYRESYAGRFERRRVTRQLMPLISDPRNLRLALERVCSNRGGSTPGIDRVTARDFDSSLARDEFLFDLEHELKSGTFRPLPILRHWIPKKGKNDLRPLGIPALRDRCVQAATLHILDPIFEARLSSATHGFRKGRGVISAAVDVTQHLSEVSDEWRLFPDTRSYHQPRKYQWVIEGDIKGFFDHLSHRKLIGRLRDVVTDVEVIDLIKAFLVVPISDKGLLTQPVCGVPQGSLISPLLSNMALAVLDERYPRRLKEPLVNIVRYGDDFVVFVRGTRTDAENEKSEIADLLRKKVGVELHPEKTKITRLSQSFEFLGHEFSRPRRGRAEMRIPAKKERRMRATIERQAVAISEAENVYERHDSLELLNATLRGWVEYFHRSENRLEVFSALDELIRLYGVSDSVSAIDCLAEAEARWFRVAS